MFIKFITMFIPFLWGPIGQYQRPFFISYRKKNNNLRELSPNAFAFDYR